MSSSVGSSPQNRAEKYRSNAVATAARILASENTDPVALSTTDRTPGREHDAVPGFVADPLPGRANQGRTDGSIGPSLLDQDDSVVLVQTGAHGDRVDARPVVAAVVRVRLKDQELSGRVLGRVVRARRCQRLALDPPTQDRRIARDRAEVRRRQPLQEITRRRGELDRERVPCRHQAGDVLRRAPPGSRPRRRCRRSASDLAPSGRARARAHVRGSTGTSRP